MKMFKKWISSALLGLALALASVPVVHAGAFTDTAENKSLDAMVRGQTLGAPTTWYMRLNTTTCTDSASGTEVSGGSYARPSVAASLTAWAGTQGAGTTTASSGSSGTTSNNAVINFATPTASWGTVASLEWMDASTGGNSWVCTPLTISKTINTGDAVSFPAAAVSLQADN